MESLMIQNFQKVAICSQEMKTYMTKQKNNQYLCKGSHPFYYQTAEQKQNKSFFIVNETLEKEAPLKFCQSVYLITDNNEYLISNPNGQIFLEKIDDPQAQDVQEMMKFRKWTLLSQSNLVSQKNVSVIDNVLFKSTFGHFLKATEDGFIANSSFIEESCVFNIKHNNLMPSLNWEITRPFISYLFLSSDCFQVLSDNQLFFSQVNYQGEFQNKYNFDSIKEAEKHIIGEVIYALSSNNGQYITRKFQQNGESYYNFFNNDQFDISFVQMINKILPLANLHDKIELFINLYGGSNKPLIFQGLCHGMREIQREYLIVLSKIEKEYGEDYLDVQKLWFYLQNPFKKYQSLGNIVEEIQLRKYPPIDILYKLLTTAIDEEMYQLFKYLMQQTLEPYIRILGDWIQYGILEDFHQEFFVEENLNLNSIHKNKKKPSFDQNYWETKYILHKDRVPVFLRNMDKKIFLIGKYMNVIKVYDPELEPKLRNDLYQNYKFTIHNDELRLHVDEAFNWANKQLINIMLIKENFFSRISKIKSYFLLDKGDFFINLMELGEEEIKKVGSNISLEKMQTFLDIALRNSYQTYDEEQEDVQCTISNYTTIELINSFQAYESVKQKKTTTFEEEL